MAEALAEAKINRALAERDAISAKLSASETRVNDLMNEKLIKQRIKAKLQLNLHWKGSNKEEAPKSGNKDASPDSDSDDSSTAELLITLQKKIQQKKKNKLKGKGQSSDEPLSKKQKLSANTLPVMEHSALTFGSDTNFSPQPTGSNLGKHPLTEGDKQSVDQPASQKG